jgi:hypothetical protein
MSVGVMVWECSVGANLEKIAFCTVCSSA